MQIQTKRTTSFLPVSLNIIFETEKEFDAFFWMISSESTYELRNTGTALVHHKHYLSANDVSVLEDVKESISESLKSL